MRVLIANTRHYRQGGDSTYTFALAEALRGAGHAVGFFAMAGKRNEPDPGHAWLREIILEIAREP